MRRPFSICLLAVVFSACAFGSEDVDNPGDDGDDAPDPDARGNDDPPIDARPPDASVPIDAPIPIDASLPVDGPPGGDLFCSSTADCAGQPGTCCFTLGQPPGFCVAGTEIGGICLPQ